MKNKFLLTSVTLCLITLFANCKQNNKTENNKTENNKTKYSWNYKEIIPYINGVKFRMEYTVYGSFTPEEMVNYKLIHDNIYNITELPDSTNINVSPDTVVTYE